METDMNSYRSEFIPVSCNYPLSHQYSTPVVEAQTSLPRNVPSGEIEAARNGCIHTLPLWGYSQPHPLEPLRWLDTVFQGQYLPNLSVNYVAINKDLEKLTPQLY